MRMIAAEITREKLTLRLHQELPYQLTVETENWEERKDGSARIDQVIYVMRDGHKGIVLGNKGETIKAVGQAARVELEEMLGRKRASVPAGQGPPRLAGGIGTLSRPSVLISTTARADRMIRLTAEFLGAGLSDPPAAGRHPGLRGYRGDANGGRGAGQAEPAGWQCVALSTHRSI